MNLNAWAAREHEIKLHEKVQRWGEAVLPLLDDQTTADLPERRELFEFLMTSVERGDSDIADLLVQHEREMIESTRSWYTDRLDFLPEERRREMIRSRFNTFLELYKAGKG